MIREGEGGGIGGKGVMKWDKGIVRRGKGEGVR